MSFSDLVLTPIYTAFSVNAVFQRTDMGTVTLAVIDRTAGVENIIQGQAVSTIKPALAVRNATLTAAGLDPARLDGVRVTLNSKRWIITHTKQAPGMEGEASGETIAFLRTYDGGHA